MIYSTILGTALAVTALALIGRMGDPNSPFPIGLLVRLVHGLAQVALSAAKWVLGEAGFTHLRQAWRYVIFTANPILMIIYSIVVYGGFMVYFIQGIQWLPEDSLHRSLTHGLLLICFVSFYIASDSDPGYLTEENFEEHSGRYPYDNCLFFPGKNCSTCNITKLARSKHCALCDRCVARFDHHCVWINNCVGEKNYKWFLLFVFTHLILTWYGPVVMLTVLAGILKQSNYWSRVFPDPRTGLVRGPTLWDANRFLAQNYTLLWGITGLLCVMGIFLILFFSYHLYGSLGNTTTNERNKRSQLQSWISKRSSESGKDSSKTDRSFEKLGDKDINDEKPDVNCSNAETKSKDGNGEADIAPVTGTCWPDINSMVTSGASFEEVVPRSRKTQNDSETKPKTLETKKSERKNLKRDKNKKESETTTSSHLKHEQPLSDGLKNTKQGGKMPKSSPLAQTSVDPELASPNSWPLDYWKHAIDQNIYDRAQIQFGIHKNALAEITSETRNVLLIPSEIDSFNASWMNLFEALGLRRTQKLFREHMNQEQ